MIFSEEFLNDLRKCRTSTDLSKKINEIEIVLKEIKKLRCAMKNRECDAVLNEMIKLNQEY